MILHIADTLPREPVDIQELGVLGMWANRPRYSPRSDPSARCNRLALERVGIEHLNVHGTIKLHGDISICNGVVSWHMSALVSVRQIVDKFPPKPFSTAEQRTVAIGVKPLPVYESHGGHDI